MNAAAILSAADSVPRPARFHALVQATRRAALVARTGTVRRLSGHAIVADGPDVVLGETCRIVGGRAGAAPIDAEVVAIAEGSVTLLPCGSASGCAPGDAVVALGQSADIGVGDALLGRVIDGFGAPLDGRPPPATVERRPLTGGPRNPLERPPVTDVLETGVRAVDALLTLGRGQRIGLFAGSGVGKSTLLGRMTRHVQADVRVVALIGERGREVRDFVERHLGPEGLARSVVVVAASDQPALARLRAAHAAVAIAEAFRDAGRHVLLTMDSVTRYAMARREVGLAAGEPPTARGYTPSVFSDIPRLVERCGTGAGGGSISALFTVLVEGDDPNEPIADCLRAALDGHIVLARAIAHRGRFPAIDVLGSTSRLATQLASAEARALAAEATRVLAALDRNRAMLEVGAYTPGTNAELDRALAVEPALEAFLGQSADDETPVSRSDALAALATALRGTGASVPSNGGTAPAHAQHGSHGHPSHPSHPSQSPRSPAWSLTPHAPPGRSAPQEFPISPAIRSRGVA